MVEISYSEHYELAELAGKSIAEVREQYTSEFEIPDRAQAILNDKPLKKKLEAEIKLEDSDMLSFEEKSRRGLVVLGAFLLTLLVTGGLFAYTYTVDTITITTVVATADFASVTANATTTALDYQLLGSVNGKLGSQDLFAVTGDSDYSGDVEVLVSLANADELVQEYRFWMMRVELTDAGGSTKVDKEGITKVISLDKPSTSFVVDSANITGQTVYVYCQGGSYKTFPFVQLGTSHSDPLIFCEVVQASQYLGTP